MYFFCYFFFDSWFSSFLPSAIFTKNLTQKMMIRKRCSFSDGLIGAVPCTICKLVFYMAIFGLTAFSKKRLTYGRSSGCLLKLFKGKVRYYFIGSEIWQRSFKFNRSYPTISDILLALVLAPRILPYYMSIGSALTCCFVELSS